MHTALFGLEAELCGKISHRDPEIYTWNRAMPPVVEIIKSLRNSS